MPNNEILLDNEIKKLLAEKPFLAYIMKYCIREYEHEEIDTIMKDYIEPHIRISMDHVHGERIIGSRNENNEDEESFPSILPLKLPCRNKRIG